MDTSGRIFSYAYVEDNDDLRESFIFLLTREDRKISGFRTAEEALEIDKKLHFEILITDVSLPGMSGTELIRTWLRNDPTRWALICSGYQFDYGLDLLGPNVRSILKTCELDELETLLDEIQIAIQKSSDHAPVVRIS